MFRHNAFWIQWHIESSLMALCLLWKLSLGLTILDAKVVDLGKLSTTVLVYMYLKAIISQMQDVVKI